MRIRHQHQLMAGHCSSESYGSKNRAIDKKQTDTFEGNEPGVSLNSKAGGSGLPSIPFAFVANPGFSQNDCQSENNKKAQANRHAPVRTIVRVP